MQNWEQYQAAYQAADQKTKDIVHSSLISECVTAAVTKYELDISQTRTLIQIFASKVVGVADETATTESMRSVGIPAAAVICKEIVECLNTKKATVADTALIEIVGTEEELSTIIPIQTTSTPVPQPPTTPTLAEELAEAEAALHQLQPIRTMASDMQTLRPESEVTHQASSQDFLLDGDGNGKKNPDARWGAGQ